MLGDREGVSTPFSLFFVCFKFYSLKKEKSSSLFLFCSLLFPYFFFSLKMCICFLPFPSFISAMAGGAEQVVLASGVGHSKVGEVVVGLKDGLHKGEMSK